jgi:hypothetical protein
MFDLIFNVDEADAASPGCAGHQDPACLCDVDTSLTADITWDRAHPDFIDVETREELLDTVGRVLARHDWGVNSAKLHRRKREITDQGAVDTVLRHDGLLEYIWEHPEISDEAIGEHFDGCNRYAIERVRRIMGRIPRDRTRRGGSGTKKYPRELALAFADQGMNSREIVDALAERGYESRVDTICKLCARNGRKLPTAPYWRGTPAQQAAAKASGERLTRMRQTA